MSTCKIPMILLRRSLIFELPRHSDRSQYELTKCRLEGVKGNGKYDCERAKHIRMLNVREKKGFVVKGQFQFMEISIIFIQV
jgi:hypothetical protein